MEYKKKIIVEGISFNKESNDYTFNFKQDTAEDILFLKYHPKTKVIKGSLNDYIIYYGYKTNSKIEKESIHSLLKYLKDHKNYQHEYNLLLEKAILGLNTQLKLNTIDCIISPNSSSTITSDISKKIYTKHPNAVLANQSIVKNSLENIKVDSESYLNSAKDEKDRKKKESYLRSDWKRSTETGQFKMKEIFGPRRTLYSNFLVFDSHTDRMIYNAINNGNVLLIDDIKTSGTSFKDMIREILQYNPKSITLFSLIKNI